MYFTSSSSLSPEDIINPTNVSPFTNFPLACICPLPASSGNDGWLGKEEVRVENFVSDTFENQSQINTSPLKFPSYTGYVYPVPRFFIPLPSL